MKEKKRFNSKNGSEPWNNYFKKNDKNEVKQWRETYEEGDGEGRRDSGELGSDIIR